jgi:hypothetical protein
MINIIITATSPPIIHTYGPLDEDSVFAEEKHKNVRNVPQLDKSDLPHHCMYIPITCII